MVPGSIEQYSIRQLADLRKSYLFRMAETQKLHPCISPICLAYAGCRIPDGFCQSSTSAERMAIMIGKRATSLSFSDFNSYG